MLRTSVQILLAVEQGRTKAGFNMLVRFSQSEQELMLQLMSIRDPHIREKIQPVLRGKGSYGPPNDVG